MEANNNKSQSNSSYSSTTAAGNSSNQSTDNDRTGTSAMSGPTTSSGVTTSPGAAASVVISEEQLMAALKAAEGDEEAALTIGQLLQQQEGGFMVEPLSWCPHVDSCVSSLPTEGVDIADPCFECTSLNENWVCLSCYKVGCGRFVSKHMLSHGEKEQHHLVLSYSDLTVWCYSCQQYVHNKAFKEVKEFAYKSKFGEDMPVPESWRN